VNVEGLRTLEQAHAVIAWAAVVSLVAASWIIARRRPPRRGGLAAGGAALALVIAAVATGIALHDPYRARLRQRLFVRSMRLGWLFEQKQHLAFAALLFAVAAAASLGALALAECRGSDPAEHPARVDGGGALRDGGGGRVGDRRAARAVLTGRRRRTGPIAGCAPGRQGLYKSAG
jgi:hypothetical protein